MIEIIKVSYHRIVTRCFIFSQKKQSMCWKWFLIIKYSRTSCKLLMIREELGTWKYETELGLLLCITEVQQRGAAAHYLTFMVFIWGYYFLQRQILLTMWQTVRNVYAFVFDIFTRIEFVHPFTAVNIWLVHLVLWAQISALRDRSINSHKQLRFHILNRNTLEKPVRKG